MSRSTLFRLLLAALFAIVPATPLAGRGGYDALVDTFFDDVFRTNPTFATELGLHQYDTLLEDHSPSARLAYATRLKRYLEQFKGLHAMGLSPSDRDDLDMVFGYIWSNLLEIENIGMWRRDPDSYSSSVANAVFSLIKRSYAPADVRMRSVIAREERIPLALAEAQKALINPPRIYTEIAIEQIPDIIDFFRTTVPEALADVVDPALRARFEKSNARVIEALDEYRVFLDKLLPRSNGSFAIGEENFRRKLWYEEMVSTPLDSLLAIGYAQLRRDQKALEETARLIDPNRSTLEVVASIELDHPTAGNLIASAQRDLDKMRQFLIDRKIVSIPGEEQAQVRETPPFMRATTFASMDTPGPFETGVADAFYFITLPDSTWPAERQEEYLRGYNYPIISNVGVHEVWPGHYLQFLWMRNNPDLSKVRKILGAASNSEGWAHYAEQMMLDEGYGMNDPKLRLGQLVDALLRDCRFIVGIKLHTAGMTLDEARQFFVTEGYQLPVNADMETKRGTSDPTYLIYTLGKLKIYELRDAYRKRLGNRYTLQSFHDAFIHAGSPPIEIVRREMMRGLLQKERQNR